MCKSQMRINSSSTIGLCNSDAVNSEKESSWSFACPYSSLFLPASLSHTQVRAIMGVKGYISGDLNGLENALRRTTRINVETTWFIWKPTIHVPKDRTRAPACHLPCTDPPGHAVNVRRNSSVIYVISRYVCNFCQMRPGNQ